MNSDEIGFPSGQVFNLKTLSLQDVDGRPVSLRTQSAEVLACLARNPGATLGKDRIISEVWRDTFVTDDSLIQCIADIRRAVGDGDHKIVQTFSKKGYRLNVERPTTSLSEGTAEVRHRTRLRSIFTATTVFALVALAFVLWLLARPEPLPEDALLSIAVLPFDDFSVGEDEGYLSDAIAEGIITQLARNKALRVIARNSSFLYRSTDKGTREIGEELGVRYVLEGSQQKSGDDLRVTVQLIDALSEEHIWANTYDQNISDLFAVQDLITRTVADRVGKQMEKRPLPEANGAKVSALHYQLQGIQSVRKNFSPEGVALLREFGLKSISADPTAPYGFIALAWSYRNDAVFGWNGMDRDEALTMAEQNADKAIELAPDDAEAHYIRARLHVERNEIDKAIIRYARAIELNPSESRILNGSADALLYVGRTDEGIDRIRQAMGIDPFHPDDFHWQMSWALWQNGDCESAETSMRRMDKIPAPAQRMFAATLACQGKIEEAKAALAIFLEGSNQNTLAGERERMLNLWTAPGALDRWIADLRLAGMPE